jgi:uracil phosphoribosyltransferase
MSSLPSNVTVSSHPCLLAKLSQLRSASTSNKETRLLVHELALLLGAEALAKAFTVQESGEQDVTPLGASFNVQKAFPQRVVLVPVLRSGLAMIDGWCSISRFEVESL